MQDEETRELVPITRPSMLVRPVATADEMRGAITEYEALKAAILRPGDIQVIKGRPHVKKAGWLRIARAFGISCAPVESHYILDDDNDDWGYEVIMRATAPNGAEMTGDGACWASEKHESMRTRHNVRAHAFTRATNRAISNLVGAGEVSAEELTDYIDADPAPLPMRKPKTLKERWSELQLRAKERGVIKTQHDWEDSLCQVLDKNVTDTSKLTVADYNKMLAHFAEEIARRTQEAEEVARLEATTWKGGA